MSHLANLKICFIALTLGQGGAERQLYYMVKVLKNQGANVRILSLTRGEFWETQLKELGVPVIWVGQHQSRLSRIARIVAELRKDPPDIVQSQHLFTNLYASVTARLLGLRGIGAIRNDGITGVDKIGRLASYFSFRLPLIIAANSQAAVRNVVNQGVSSSKLFFLPNVVDTGYFSPSDGSLPSPIRLATVGRLVEQKRFDRFLSVLKLVQQKTTQDVKGVIVGSGSLRPELEKYAVELGLMPDTVTFKGRLDNVVPAYQQADMFVLTSDWEGTPNVVLEAMACGLPVIATRVGGVPDIVQSGETGFVVETGNEKLMVDLLSQLVEDPDLRRRMGHCAREYVVANYSLESLPGYLSSLYDLVLSEESLNSRSSRVNGHSVYSSHSSTK